MRVCAAAEREARLKATRNGRITHHTAHVDLIDPAPWSSDATKGEVWPYKLIVNLQYSWADGAWHVLSTVVYSWRTPPTAGADGQGGRGSGVKVTITRPENIPDWAVGIITDNTPSSLAAPEMIRA